MLQIKRRALLLLTLTLLVPLATGCAFDSPPPSGLATAPSIPPLPAQARPDTTKRPSWCLSTCSKGFESWQDKQSPTPTTSPSGSMPASAPTIP